ncbi:hypothetical protein J6524_31290 [Bradyrhizobium sp. WSM 1738]|uniref:hypothetical protein n=1 Tax=Bradyrhizobium hereditatis TaxID=2821405 RepID=UPI001CE36C08|nr:hypothetical protein [Bradyrhizobium hereditatis]MCA6119323.1 hypothetical protein [Bradyrhizobium hereditatis]
MTKSQTGEDALLPISVPSGFLGSGKTAMGEVIFGIDFTSKRRERIYDADKVWSGEHTILDFTEI